MQSTVSNLRNSLWSNLKTVYDQFPTQQGEIQVSTVEEFIRGALG